MAFQVRFKIVLLMQLLLFFSKTSIVASIPTQELDAMLSTVRARGYNLFSNAIATSDLQLDLLTAADNASFTFFAPTDSSLFALAMTLPASAYTATLRFHGLPRRLSVYALNRFPSQLPIPTLLRSHCLFVTRRRQGSRSQTMSVNGIDVVLPGLYYGRHIAVHGLGGILSLHSQMLFPFHSPPPQSFPPRIDHSDFTLPPTHPPIGHPSVSPPITPSNSSKKTADLPLHRVFLGPAPELSHFQVEPPAIPSVSPLASPGIPPVVSSDYLPPWMENEKAETPSPLIGSPVVGDSAWRMEPEGRLSGRTTDEEEYEPLDWMTFGFTDGNSKGIDVEDSHPPPNSLRS